MSNFIFEKRNTISTEKCNNLIEIFEASDYAKKEQHKFKGKLVKSGSSVIITEEFLHKNKIWLDELNDFYSILGHYSSEYVKKYFQSLHFIGSWRNETYSVMSRFDPGESFCDWHCEQGNLNKSSRILAWMFYLNDVTDGGKTAFLNQRVGIKPESGKLVIWPSSWTHTHKGLISRTQTKYILTGWFRFY